jgi:very-short-patch-repair endonuclease
MAAVLAYWPRAVLSFRSAAALSGIRPTARERIEVTLPGRPRARAGIQIHDAALAAHEVTRRRGIPVTTPTRTLVDLAGVLDQTQLRRALDEAEVLGLLDRQALATAAVGRRGTRALLALLAEGEIGARRTRRELERRFLEFLRSAGLPLPETNVVLHLPGRSPEVDCLWRDSDLVVELDGHATHRTRRHFEDDRERDRALATARMTVVRLTWRQLLDGADALERDLRTLLGPARAAAPPAATPMDRFPSRGASSRPPRSWPSG